jgi:hypothetical protein
MEVDLPKPAIIRKPDPMDRHPDEFCHDDEWLRKVNPLDPRNIGHPLHDAKWLELARALGRMEARRDFEILYGKKAPDDSPKTKARYGRA